jgi:microcystin-dependent protein
MSGIPANIVIMWSGAILDIPAGWFLCDGQNGTPNLVNRFVVGAGNSYNLDATGGNKDAIVVAHTHSISYGSVGSHSHTVNYGPSGNGTKNRGDRTSVVLVSDTQGSHSHTVTINNAGSSGTDKNMPPYYALAYIMYGGE